MTEPLGRKFVKIRPVNKNLYYDGTNMEITEFIKELENAAMLEGAEAEDIVIQISNFIRNPDLLRETRDMSGRTTNNWDLLKNQMIRRWGGMTPLMQYNRKDLDNIINRAISAGGAKNIKEFQHFIMVMDSMLAYLIKQLHIRDAEEIRHSILDCVNEKTRESVINELIRDNRMVMTYDGTYLLPSYKVICHYIQRDFKAKSILQTQQPQRKLAFGNSQQAQPAPQPPVDKAMEDLTKNLTSWNVQKKPPSPFFSSSHVPYQAQRPPQNVQCHYCHMMGHTTYRCNLANIDEVQGLVKRDGREFRMPDGTAVPFDRTRPAKLVVDQ